MRETAGVRPKRVRPPQSVPPGPDRAFCRPAGRRGPIGGAPTGPDGTFKGDRISASGVPVDRGRSAVTGHRALERSTGAVSRRSGPLPLELRRQCCPNVLSAVPASRGRSPTAPIRVAANRALALLALARVAAPYRRIQGSRDDISAEPSGAPRGAHPAGYRPCGTPRPHSAGRVLLTRERSEFGASGATPARARSEILPQPVGHARVVDCPGLLKRFVFLPSVFITIEELLPVALVLDDAVAFAPILIPVVVLLPVALPLLGVDRRHEAEL